MPTTTTITQYTTIPPTVLDLHYWLWDLLVMFAVTALILSAATTYGRVSIGSGTFIYLLLIGMFTGSIIDLLFNTADWGFVVLMAIILFVYGWRTRA